MSTTSKRHYDVQASRSSEGLIDSLKAAADLKEIQDIIQTQDYATLANAFASLLKRQDPTEPSGEEASKKLKEETGEEHAEHRAVRSLSQVNIGMTLSNDPEQPDAEDQWLPLAELTDEAGTHLLPMNQLAEQLQLAHCKTVLVKLSRLQTLANDHFKEEDSEALFGMVFGGLTARDTTVDVLCVESDPFKAELTLRCIKTFKSVAKLTLQSWTNELDPKEFNEEFFLAAARRGIRSLDFKIVTDAAFFVDCDINAALVFGFAEPTSGGLRELTGVHCTIDSDFFALLCQKTNELDARSPIDFEFRLWGIDGDFVGFPAKYESTDETWIIDDADHVQNGVVVKIYRRGRDLRLEVMTSLGSESSTA